MPTQTQMPRPVHRVLIVDDDPTVRLLTREALEQAGLRVAEASDGMAALERFQAQPMDLLLLDVRMPGMDGFSVCSALRQLPNGQDATIVMVTGLDDHDSIRRAYEVGATDFITKPLNWPILIQRVRHLLRARDTYHSLRRSEARLAEAQRIAHLGHWEWHIASGALHWSEETYRIFGYKPSQFAATYPAFLDRVHPNDREKVKEMVDKAVNHNTPYAIEHRITLPDGNSRVVFEQGKVINHQNGSPLRMVGIVQDITERKNAERRIFELAYYDELTGLPNRSLLIENIRHALPGGARTNSFAALLHLDLDRFKRINDTLGHETGNQLLKAAAKRIHRSVHGSDTVADPQSFSLARPGGDEFLILLPALQQASCATRVAQGIMNDLKSPIQLGERDIYISASIGIAICPEDGTTPDDLLRHADAALHQAKQAGGNGYRFYFEELNRAARHRLSLETRLRHALDAGELELYYQPQTDLRSGRTVGLEALLRWNDPRRGVISPAEFIPVAEESGLIVPIGDWVLQSACRQIAAWERAGFTPVPVAVNLSARQFQSNDLLRQIVTCLSDSNIAPAYLELELTESVVMQDAHATLRILQALKSTGLRVSVDDFGTGYSSMSYLKQFPLDTLKIDRGFVMDVVNNRADHAIVGAIIALAQALELITIAEGVEQAAQRDALMNLDCDRMQGFLVSRPLTAERIEAFLKREGTPVPLSHR